MGQHRPPRLHPITTVSRPASLFRDDVLDSNNQRRGEIMTVEKGYFIQHEGNTTQPGPRVCPRKLYHLWYTPKLESALRSARCAALSHSAVRHVWAVRGLSEPTYYTLKPLDSKSAIQSAWNPRPRRGDIFSTDLPRAPSALIYSHLLNQPLPQSTFCPQEDNGDSINSSSYSSDNPHHHGQSSLLTQ